MWNRLEFEDLALLRVDHLLSIMGNASSSTAKTAETRVDHGYLTPHGIYTGTVDWNQHIVGHLILERRLAPFYRPLEDYEESWDDETILAHRKGLDAEGEAQAAAQEHHQQHQSQSSRHGKSHQQRQAREVQKLPTEAQIYRGAVECPICFMVTVCPLLLDCEPGLLT
jgi:hypothetical protein